jgi:hypothetical protein
MAPRVQDSPQRCHAWGRPGALGTGTIDTSTIDRATHETFDQALTGEVIRSEILRLTIVALLPGLGLARWIALALGREDVTLERASLPLLAVVGGLAVAYELYIIPVAWLFFVFILRSTLHLDFWLCAFTGLVAVIANLPERIVH